jgi:hypothetical protein
MCLVGLSHELVLAAHVVEGMHLIRIVGEGSKCSQLHRLEAVPEPITFVAKGPKAALALQPNPGQDEDVHCSSQICGRDRCYCISIQWLG